jgi:integrase
MARPPTEAAAIARHINGFLASLAPSRGNRSGRTAKSYRTKSKRVDFVRHTFCCHTLRKAAREGTDMRAFLPVLAEYLGHESIVATSQYLKMTAEVHPDIRELVDRACSDVIPAVKP